MSEQPRLQDIALAIDEIRRGLGRVPAVLPDPWLRGMREDFRGAGRYAFMPKEIVGAMLSELASPGQPRGLSPIEARHVGQQFVDLQDQGADIVMMPRDDICRLIDTVVGHREVKLRSSERG